MKYVFEFLFYSAPVYTSEDVCWNIRNVKLKFHFSPEMHLYFLLFINAVCCLDGQKTRTRTCESRQEPITGAGFWPICWVQKERNETWNENDLNCENTKIKWRNDSSLSHSLLSAEDAWLLRLPRFPSPVSPSPRHRERVKVKGGVTVRSSPLPSRSATSCFAVSYFYSADYSVKHCFLSPIFKKVFR